MQDIQNIEFEERKSHPFKDMLVGQVEIVDVELQSYVHAYGSNCGKKFVTRKINGSLHVKRVK